MFHYSKIVGFNKNGIPPGAHTQQVSTNFLTRESEQFVDLHT